MDDARGNPDGSCNERCRTRVECLTCHRTKAPVGRSIAAEAANGYCNFECRGYRDHPLPGHLFPSEELEDGRSYLSQVTTETGAEKP